METAIVAEFAGTVREVLVQSNTQVGAGARCWPSNRPRPRKGSPPAPASTSTTSPATKAPCTTDAATTSRRSDNSCSASTSTPDALERMTAGNDICGDPINPQEQVAMEEEILSLFVDVISLFRRNPVDTELDSVARRATEEHLFNYLRRLDTMGEGLPEHFAEQLRTTLAISG